MTTHHDLAHWLTVSEAAARLARSEKTILRMASAGQLQRRDRPRAGKKPEAVIHPADVERLEQAMHAPHVLPPTAATGNQASTALAPNATTPVAQPPHTTGVAIRTETPMPVDALIASLTRASGPPPLWLTIAQASEYSGLSQALLRRLIHTGALPSIRDRAVKVRRADLDSIDPAAPPVAERLNGGKA